VVFRQVAHLPPFLALLFSPIADPSFGIDHAVVSFYSLSDNFVA